MFGQKTKKLKAELLSCRQEIDILNERIREREATIMVLRGSITDWRRARDNAQYQSERKDTEIARLKKELEKVNKLNRHLEAEIERKKAPF